MNLQESDNFRVFVEECITDFHRKRIESLEKLKLRDVLKRKNQYLFRAKNLNTADEIVAAILSAYLSSQEETLFGEVFEKIAIFICQQKYGGQKSSAEGIDLEFLREGIRYFVSIKSGPNWGNSSQIKKMTDNFQKIRKVLQTNARATQISFVNGCCYGQTDTDNGAYRKVCGQAFWELISGEEDIYTEIIEPIGYRAKEKNDEFAIKYAQSKNRFVRDFIHDFCDTEGSILWGKLIALTSQKQ
jgi:Type II restriction endonuclease EcoO109I